MKKLLTYETNETTYGILYDEIISVNTTHSISRLPLVPDYIAGMTKINGKTVPLADLNVCIGLPPISRKKVFQTITFSDTANATSFIIEGTTTDILIPPEAILPVHDYLKSKIINRYALYDNTIIPIINISFVYGWLQSGKTQPINPEYHLPVLNIKQSKSFRCFKLNKQVLIGIADRFFDTSLPLGSPVRLPGLKNFVEGFIHDEGQMLPVISLSQYVETGDGKLPNKIIRAEVQGYFFGFPVAEDLGDIQQEDSPLLLLPPLMQSRLVQNTLKINNEFVPALNLMEYLRIEVNNNESRFLPNSADQASAVQDSEIRHLEGERKRGGISCSYGKEPIEVIEFAIDGSMHALPSCEVSEWFPAIDFQTFPVHRPVVIGICEYKNKLLPVLDPSVCFDSHTDLNNDCYMLLIEKNDFCAFVITNKTSGKKKLPVELQRELPVEQSFNFFYGCYPEKNNVRLIFNMEVIAHNFSSEMTAEFYCTSKVNYAYNPEEEKVESPLQDVPPIESRIQNQENQIYDDFILLNDTRQTPPAALISPKEPEKKNTNDNFYSLEIQKEKSDENHSDQKIIIHHTLVSDIIKNTSFQTRPDTTCHAPLTQIQPSTFMLICAKPPESSPWSGTPAFNPPAPLHLPPSHTPDKRIKTTFTTLKASQPETNQFPYGTIDKCIDHTASDDPTINTIETHRLGFPDDLKKSAPKWQPIIPKNKRRWPLILAATLSILLIMIYFNMHEQKIQAQKKIPVTRTSEIHNKMQSLPTPIETNKTPQTEKEVSLVLPIKETAPVPVKEKRADFTPQNSNIPETPPEISMESEFETYNVVKGDSLWKISKRFTGSGFNFMDVARDNYISNPDLIFPEQTILIKNRTKDESR